MDLAIGAKQMFVMMTLFAKDGTAKLVPECTYPLTGVRCVTPGLHRLRRVRDRDAGGAQVAETLGISFAELATRVDVTLPGG